MEGKETPSLLNHLLLHFQSQWGFLEEAVSPRDFDSVYGSQGSQSSGHTEGAGCL